MIFHFSWEVIWTGVLVILEGLLLAFIGYRVRGVWGALELLVAGALLYKVMERHTCKNILQLESSFTFFVLTLHFLFLTAGSPLRKKMPIYL